MPDGSNDLGRVGGRTNGLTDDALRRCVHRAVFTVPLCAAPWPTVVMNPINSGRNGNGGGGNVSLVTMGLHNATDAIYHLNLLHNTERKIDPVDDVPLKSNKNKNKKNKPSEKPQAPHQ